MTASDTTSSDNPALGPLVLIQHPPYQGHRARAGVDCALSFAVFSLAPVLVFVGDGVLCLTESAAAADGRKSLRKLIDSLPLYDIETVFVEEQALRRFSLDTDQLPVFARVLSATDLHVQLNTAPSVLSY